MFKMSAAWDIFKSERLINLHRHFAYECLDKQGDSQKSKRKKSETHKSSQAGCVPNVNISPGLQSLWDFHLGHT